MEKQFNSFQQGQGVSPVSSLVSRTLRNIKTFFPFSRIQIARKMPRDLYVLCTTYKGEEDTLQ